jgi:hypothetical protein
MMSDTSYLLGSTTRAYILALRPVRKNKRQELAIPDRNIINTENSQHYHYPLRSVKHDTQGNIYRELTTAKLHRAIAVYGWRL